ncbi:MAG: cyclic nucleotide-binding domain-containing protein [Verrucomicrobiota bacterium]
MNDALELLGELTPEDTDWLFSASEEERFESGATVIEEGSYPDFVYFVLTGILGVRISVWGDELVAKVGAGELLGEMSFLHESQATATVEALEPSLLLKIPRLKLIGRIEADDTGFGARFYRAIALIVSRRLRDLQQRHPLPETSYVRLSEQTRVFTSLLREAEEAALKQEDNEVPAEFVPKVHEGFDALLKFVNDEIGDQSQLPEAVRAELGARLREDLQAFLLLTNAAERMYSKPRGYAGDFLTIHRIYENEPSGKGRLGPLLDDCVLSDPASKAVRNRRQLLAERIEDLVLSTSETTYVTSFACGPATEIFDVFDKLGPDASLHANLVDFDPEALEFVRQRAEKRGLADKIHLHNANPIYLATGSEKLELNPQHFIYATGLIDYFRDQFAVSLLNYIHILLADDGEVVLGNFHPNNHSKAFMDYVLDWRLIHRTEEDLNRIFESSAFGAPSADIFFEEERVNIFATGRK